MIFLAALLITPQQGTLNETYTLSVSDSPLNYEEAKQSFEKNPFILPISSANEDGTFHFYFEPTISGELVINVGKETSNITVKEGPQLIAKPASLIDLAPVIPFKLSQENEIFLNQELAKEPHRNVSIVRSKTFPWFGLFLLLCIGAFLPFAILLLKKRKNAPLAPREEALEELKEMQTKPYTNTQDLYTDLTNLVRTYLEKTYNLPITHLTTEEFFLQTKDMAGLRTPTLEFFLTEADKVKFAQKVPTDKEINSIVQAAKQLIIK